MHLVLFHFLRCHFTNAPAQGNKGKNYSLILCIQFHRQPKAKQKTATDYTENSDPICGVEGNLPWHVEREWQNDCEAMVCVLLKKNGELHKGDLWKLEKKANILKR